MNKYTPGNWKIGNISSVVTDVRRNREHTDIDEKSIAFYGGELICESIENESDAHLIAAAPELLEALEKVCYKIAYSSATHPFTKSEVEMFHNAIKKAEGR